MLGRIFNGSGKPIDKGPTVMAEDFLDIQVIYVIESENFLHWDFYDQITDKKILKFINLLTYYLITVYRKLIIPFS